MEAAGDTVPYSPVYQPQSAGALKIFMEPGDVEPGDTPEILERWSQRNVAGVPAQDMVEY